MRDAAAAPAKPYDPKMSFGRFKGQRASSVPDWYHRWLISRSFALEKYPDQYRFARWRVLQELQAEVAGEELLA